MYNKKKDRIWFLGRSYNEYLKMFSLNRKEIENNKILDCAAGASSFTPHMLNNGGDVTAVDILYGKDPQKIKDQCENDFNTLLEVHSDLNHKVNWSFFKGPKDMIKQRISVYKEFIKDYAHNGNRYIHAGLPSLPFHEDSFDLTLCSHLLFLYQDRLGYKFHRESIEEMIRISSKEVRIYPIVKLRSGGNKSSFLSRIISELSDIADFEIVEVNYKFRKGGNEMLKIIKT
jgi:SAM-dependent methyltransferase